MTHAATKWWLVGGFFLVIGLGIALYFGYQSGTFVLFGQNPNRVEQYVPPTSTCWTFQSYSNQQFTESSLASCKANQYWAGWYPTGRPYSSTGTYNPTPAALNWDDTDGMCLLTNGNTVFNNLYECITQYKVEPSRWLAHYNGGEINNPDIATSRAATTPLVSSESEQVRQNQRVISIDETIGYCYGVTSSGGFEGRKTKADCMTLYNQYLKDGNFETNVDLWCALRGVPNTCLETPY